MIGTAIYGYCNGFFGRDDYDDKLIILEGRTWILCRYMDRDEVTCANFDSEDEKLSYIASWQTPEQVILNYRGSN